MVRTQIQLKESTYREIKRIAYEKRKSMSEVVREILERTLEANRPRKKNLTLADFTFVGKFRSSGENISENHDDYLAEDFR